MGMNKCSAKMRARIIASLRMDARTGIRAGVRTREQVDALIVEANELFTRAGFPLTDEERQFIG